MQEIVDIIQKIISDKVDEYQILQHYLISRVSLPSPHNMLTTLDYRIDLGHNGDFFGGHIVIDGSSIIFDIGAGIAEVFIIEDPNTDFEVLLDDFVKELNETASIYMKLFKPLVEQV